MLYPPPAVAASKINLNRMGSRAPATEQAPLSTSAAEKSEAKYRVGITKDQKLVHVYEESIYLPGGERKKVVQAFYEVDMGPGVGKVHVILMEHSAGNGHGHPHWEVGLPKSDGTGCLDLGESGERAALFITGKISFAFSFDDLIPGELDSHKSATTFSRIGHLVFNVKVSIVNFGNSSRDD